MTGKSTEETLSTLAADRVLRDLAAEQSQLVRDPHTAQEVYAQVVSIATAAVRTLHADPIDGVAATLADSSIGRRRAATSIHPQESLRAAHLAFQHIYPLLVETLPEFSTQGAIDAAGALQTVISNTIVAASTGYVDTLFEKLSTIAAEERRAISRDLHDRTMQGIAAALQQCELEPTPVKALTRILRETLDETRSMALELRQIVGDRALDDAISAYLADIRELKKQSGVVGLLRSGAPRRLRVLAQEQAFIITREAVQNAVRHSNAVTITVGLAWRPKSLLISVADDGVGFDPLAVSSERLGLLASRERAHAIGASFVVGPAPGGGTLMRLAVPE